MTRPLQTVAVTGKKTDSERSEESGYVSQPPYCKEGWPVHFSRRVAQRECGSQQRQPSSGIIVLCKKCLAQGVPTYVYI